MVCKCLVVTGSRSLEDLKSDLVRDRVKTILSYYVLHSYITVVVAGDARGPDTWAMEFTKALFPHVEKRRWKLDGYIDSYDDCNEVYWAKLVKNRELLKGKAWPLTRDRLMIESVAKKYPGEARVVGFTNKLSSTRGTEFTLEQAEKNGIMCNEWTYAPEYEGLFTAVDRP